MCGINGLWHRDGRPVDPVVLDRMTDRLAHRGPDDRGTWIDGSIGFGHRRLAILDLSADGRQPMQDPTGRITLTYNGEIYNFRRLRETLAREGGYRFRTECDAEILPVGYLHWGMDLFDRLEGMFALALWDAREETLLLARDGIGIKPLYVATFGDAVQFASEIKAFEETGCPWQLDPLALDSMLANGYPPPDRTLIVGIDQVPPGTVRRFDRAGVRDTRFWRPRRAPDIHDMDEAVAAVRGTLETVVEDMLQSDVPVGVLQSGGIDSSLISTALAGRDVPLFTARFEDADFDETAIAADVARSVDGRHHVIPVTAIADPVATFTALAQAYDGQLADSSGFAAFELCRAIRGHVTVALSGEGGDEFFAGYPTYRATRLADAAGGFLPSPVWTLLGRMGLAFSRGNQDRLPVSEKFARFCFGNAARGPAHPQWRRQLFEADRQALSGPGLRDVRTSDPMAGYAAALDEARSRHPAGSLTDWALLADQTYYLPGDLLAKADRVSMAHGLEIRVPFLDRRIMDLAGRLDMGLMTGWRGPDKKVLRAALAASNAPDSVVRHAKRGFMVPIARMLREHLRPLSERFFDRNPDLFAPYLNPDGVRRLWRAHDDRRANHKYPLWLLLTLGVWIESHV